MVGSGQEDLSPKSEIITKALNYIRSFAKPDGGIYGNFYPSYTTSICAMALLEAGLPDDRDLLRKARSFLLDSQADESQDITKADPQYGGWGYEKNPSGAATHRPDLSNTQFALETLKNLEAVAQEDVAVAGTGQNAQTRTELAYDRAIVFLQRCQNLKACNDQPWATNDGGFVYKPGESKAGEDEGGGLRSYGGMTYAGLKSMVYARLKKDDPRVVAAFEWIRRHWTVTENPELGEQGLYYYYLTMARALSACGVETVVDAQGRPHDWRRELTAQLLKLQKADGSWANTNGRWMEQIPDLTTAYCVLAIENASHKW
jgi:squalene-hopene/tetraprenyl-beta-curcumene cyclase